MVGACTVDQRRFAVATTKHAAASITGLVQFLVADAVSSARVKYIATPGVGTARAAVVPALDTVDKNY